MIHLYKPDNTNYDANGDIILLPYKCEETAGINRTWQIDLEHPIDDEGRWEYIVADAVIKCPSFNGVQLWRIVQTEKSDNGVTATCDPIFYDAAHEVVFVDRVTLNNVTCQQAIDALTDGTKFSGESNITGVASMWFQTENLIETITGSEHGLVKHYDCEVGFDNYKVLLLDKLGGDYGASVLYGKNLVVDGIRESFNIDGTYTRVIPVAYNGYTLPELYVDSENIDKYPFPRIGFIQYDNLRLYSDREEGEQGDSNTEYFNTKEELYTAMREAVQKAYTEDELDKPSVSMEVEMVLIQNTEEYKDYKDLETVSLGDYVRCYNPRIGIDSKTRVRLIVYDCIRESVISVELGHEKRNYFDNVSAMIERIGATITPGGNVIAERVAGFLNGAITQLRLQNTVAKKQDVRAILFEDLDPDSPTFGALAIGTQGWQISKRRTTDGRDWEWTTAATSGGIIANTVVTGLLSDKLAKNYWNLDTGDFRLTGATLLDSDIDGYATDGELSSGLSSTLSSAKTYADGVGTSANTYTNSAITALNNSLDQQAIFNRLTNNGAAEGIYLENGKLYVNGTYIKSGIIDGALVRAGIITDKTGTNYWNLDTGEFSLTGYVTDSELSSGLSSTLSSANTNAQGYANSALSSAQSYADSAASDAVSDYNTNLNQEAIFNKLTNNGAVQGIKLVNGQLYVNASYIQSGTLKLGGANNTNGRLQVYDASNTLVGQWDKDGITIKGGDISGATITSNYSSGNKGVKIQDGEIYFYSDTSTEVLRGGVHITSSGSPGAFFYVPEYQSGGFAILTSSNTYLPLLYHSGTNSITQIGSAKNYHISLNGITGTTTIAGRNSSDILTTTRMVISGSDDYATLSGTWRINGPLQVYDSGWTSGITGTYIADSFGGLRARRYVRGILISDSSYTASRAVSYKGFLAAGCITGSKKQVYFFIPSPSDLSGYNTATKNTTSPTSIYIRAIDGTDNYITLSYSNVSSCSATVASNGLFVTLTLNTALSVSNNNTPCVVSIDGSIGFNLSQ